MDDGLDYKEVLPHSYFISAGPARCMKAGSEAGPVLDLEESATG